MDEVQVTQDEPRNGIPPYRWFIGILADSNYYFITPEHHDAFVKYIGEHGGGLYTHAGYLVLAANQNWWKVLTQKYEKQYRTTPSPLRPPHIDVPNIDCKFSKLAIQWLQDNEKLLQEVGGKYYDNIPRH